MAEIKHPVVGDMVYSNGKNPFGVTRSDASCEKYRIYAPRNGKNYENRSAFAGVF